MLAFETSLHIAAPPDRIWRILTDRDRLVTGGFGVHRIEGSIAAGARLKLWSEIDPARAFALKVTMFDPGREMVWTGGMPFGLFTGVRRFTLNPEGGGVTFRMREEFTGALLGLIGKSLPDLTPSFNKFAAALKAHAEGAD